MNSFWSGIVGRYKNAKHFLVSVREVLRYGYPARKLKVIGVTGTNGKTTTSHLIYEILKLAGYKVALLSTLGLFVYKGRSSFAKGEAVPSASRLLEDKQDTGFHTTTPDATVLQPLMKQLVKNGVEYFILEVTSHGLDQHRVLGANFWAGVLTNVTHEHLDYHKTFEKYRFVKSKLFRGVKVAVLNKQSLFHRNKDDGSFEYFRNRLPKSTKLTSYSIGKPATLSASSIKTEKRGLAFSVKEGGVVHRFHSKLIARYDVANSLAAIGVTRAIGVGWSVIQQGVDNFDGVEGRLEFVPNKKGIKLVIDFAHTPAGLEGILKTLQDMIGKKGKLISVFGAAGLRDKAKRPMMGKISAKLANVTILTAEDPRTENVNDIIDSIAKGAQKGGAKEVHPEVSNLVHFGGVLGRAPRGNKGKSIYFKVPDRKKAIKLAVKIARRGDVIGIFGKGHEQSMAIGDKEYPWSDKKVVEDALASQGETLRT